MFPAFIRKIVGTKHEREIKRVRPLVAAIGELENEMRALTDEGLRRKTFEFKEKIDRGASVDDFLVPAFAVCREAGRRALNMRHYDVQLIGGIVLHEGKIAEMKTGEGKTLVATLPVYLNALAGKGVHLITVNDYLATRDAEWMGRLYGFLGLTTGVIHPRESNAEKKRAYRCDITYGQNNEFGFDYLRDNMKFSIYDYAQRDLHFAIVDEVDSILVDEARTPLIISGPGETASEKYLRIDEIIPRLLKDEHYELDEKARQVTLTEDGIELSQKMLGDRGLLEVPNLYDPVNLQSLHILQQALRAHTLYKRDVQYMVTAAGDVLIIDEFTGRTLPGRRWSDGLHQAIEAKERVSIKEENITLATISFQNLFRLYGKLAGMTGTADTEAEEFHKIYNLDVVVIPTNRAVSRVDSEDLVYKSERGKFTAIADEITERNKNGQPVLVGTTSVEKSEALSRVLEKRGIQVSVLNAKQHEREAYVIAQAGRKGAVTVATNMAGRGTDILLGGNAEMIARLDVIQQVGADVYHQVTDPNADDVPPSEAPVEKPTVTQADIDKMIAEATTKYVDLCKKEKEEVLAAGGLFILGTERHDSRRVDNQLRGRAGRQGDVGASRFYLSLEDDLMRIFAGERVQKMMETLGMEEDIPIEHKWVTRAVENAQKKVEERNFDIRKNLLDYDDVMNQQRKSIYALRRQVLTGQYRAVPTDDQKKKGIEPGVIVKEPDPALIQRAAPILEQMIRHHSAPLLRADATEEEKARVEAERKSLGQKPVSQLGPFRVEPFERDIYLWFGCQVPLSRLANEPAKALEVITREVGLSLTEQRERLLDLVDELVGNLVHDSCPAGKHHEDWDYAGLRRHFEEHFGLAATGLEAVGDREDLAKKLFSDAEAVLLRKFDEFGPESYLRLFRNVFMQEIDRQWIEHLQAMDNLRDGIGLRGYGQRDPKREYKREGFEMFQRMTEAAKATVLQVMFRAQRVSEEDLARQEAQKAKIAEERARAMRANHADGPARPASGAPGAAPLGAGDSPILNRKQRRHVASRDGVDVPTRPEAQAPAQTVKREKPKTGRNDPCWCGSGKKYKSCHLKDDRGADSVE